MAIPIPTVSKVSEVYLDESSQTKHRFLVLGCVIVSPGDCASLRTHVASARLPELPFGELKWNKVSEKKYAAYERIVRGYFDISSRTSGPHFHSLVVDTSKIKDKQFNAGSREIGFNKEIYQLLMKLRRLYPDTLYHVYPDHRTTTSRPEELRLVCNRGAKTKGDPRDWPFRRVHWRHSHDEPCLQMVDLLIGSIAYRLNRHHLAPDASPAKLRLSNLVLELAKIRDVERDTAVSSHFTVWHRQLA